MLQCTSPQGALAQLVAIADLVEMIGEIVDSAESQLRRKRMAYTGLCSLANYLEGVTGLDRRTILGTDDVGFWGDPHTLPATLVVASDEGEAA